MKIQVLGSGCSTCARLNEITQKAVNEMGFDTKVEYITGDQGMKKIIELGAMASPLLVVNDEVAMMGFTPDIERIKEKIREHIK